MDNKKRYTASIIKYIAYVSMFIDHLGHIILGRMISNMPANASKYLSALYLLTRILGRLSFPLFCFLLVEGINHSHNRLKYLSRLLLLAIISEPVFNYAMNGSLFCKELQNPIFTLFTGAILLITLQLLNQKLIFKYAWILNSLVIIIFMFISLLLKFDYAFIGIAIIAFISYILKKPYIPMHQALLSFGLLIFICELFLNIIKAPVHIFTPELWFKYYIENALALQLFSIFSLYFIMDYNHKKGNQLPKLFYYSFYPLHLLILRIIADFIFR